VPEFEDARWSYSVAEPMVFQAGFRREIENYLDMTHFAFAHSGSLGVAADSIVPAMEITEFPDGFQMEAPFPSLASPEVQPGKLQQAHQRRQRCFLPNFTTIRQSFADGDERVLVHIPSPNDPECCTVFWSLAISPGFRGPAPADQMAFAVRVLEEDRTMCENQVPREVPINPSRGGWGVLVTPGDTLANTFQRTFRKFLLRGLGQA
jgi:phenylpropionate dioxygenase-like ring-hydroxylating dioxygenase large terminal subunit